MPMLGITPLEQVQNQAHGILQVYQEKFDSQQDNNGVDFDPALSPCLKSECDRWDNGECIHIRKAGNQRIRI